MERPVFRVGVAGLDPRDARLIEIVFRHGQHNPHDFRLLDVLDMTAIDILIANASESEGLDAMAAARNYPRHIPVVVAVPRGGQTAARHSVTIDRLTLQLLPILNRVVQEEGLRGGPQEPPPICEELTVIHEAGEPSGGAEPDDADGGVAVAAAAVAVPASRTAPVRPASAVASAPASAVASAPVTTAAAEREPTAAQPEAGTGVATRAAGVATRAVTAAATAADVVPAAGTRALAGALAEIVDTLPAIEPWSLPRSPAYAVSPVGGLGQAHRLQALVIDPSLAAQQQLAAELARLGLEVHGVVSGTAAARCLATRHFDLIVTESGLADTDGFTLVHWLRRSPAHRETPVILLRSRIGWLDPARAWLDGRMTLLGKPVTRGALGRLVRQALRHSLVIDDFAI